MLIVRMMKAKLINLLLSSSHGGAVRDGLRPLGDNVFTEVFFLTVRPCSNGELACDLRASIARWGEDSTLSGEAVEVDVQFSGLLGLSFAYDDRHPELEQHAPFDVEIGDRYRILCQSWEVMKVRAYNLADEPR